MGYKATILLDSISEAGDRLTTMEVTFPRIVLAEFNTHRMLSRNSASSRAIPFEKQLNWVREDPFVPIYWGKNQPGMQATVELEGFEKSMAIEDWMKARDEAVARAIDLHHASVHKQIVNRLLEPFMWQTVIVTATEWKNFFALRANADAQPEIRVIGEMMLELYNTSKPQLIKAGEWHMPLIQPDEYEWAREHPDIARRVSAARCARVSYLTHDGVRNLDADLTLYERLVAGGHMSPLEHVAMPCYGAAYHRASQKIHYTRNWHGNFHGWKQLRKLVPGEAVFTNQQKG